MAIARFRDLDQVRSYFNDVYKQIDIVAAKLERLSQAKDAKDEEIAMNLVEFGVRIGRITEHVPGTTDITNVAHGYAQLVNIYDFATDSDRVAACFNITEKEFTVGTLVALLPVQNSFFICSDPGIFPATILPLVEFSGPVDSHFVTLEEDSPESLIFGGPLTFVVSDALDGGGDYVLSIRLISGDFVYSQGDSDVEENVIPGTPPYIELQGTLAELNDLFADNTTATLTVEMPHPGTFTLEVTLIESATNRTGTYETEVLVIPAAGGSSGAPPDINGFRLTLETGVAVSTTDQASKTTLYLTPFEHNYVGLYTGSAWVIRQSAEISIALGTKTSGALYDLFVFDDSGTPALEFGAAWTNDTTRSTALTTQDGILVKSGDATRRYIGTIRMGSTTVTHDTVEKRLVYNYYNKVRRTLTYTKSPGSPHSYTSSTVRVWNNTSDDIWAVIGYPAESDMAGFVQCYGTGGSAGGAQDYRFGMTSSLVGGSLNVSAGVKTQMNNGNATNFVSDICPVLINPLPQGTNWFQIVEQTIAGTQNSTSIVVLAVTVLM